MRITSRTDKGSMSISKVKKQCENELGTLLAEKVYQGAPLAAREREQGLHAYSTYVLYVALHGAHVCRLKLAMDHSPRGANSEPHFEH